MNDYDFWKVGLINLKGIGYFPIFKAILHSEEKFIYLSFKSFKEFHDFDYLDRWNRIRPSSELYESVMVDINSNRMQFFHSKEAAINGLMLDLYERRNDSGDEQKYMKSLFKELSMKYIKTM